MKRILAYVLAILIVFDMAGADIVFAQESETTIQVANIETSSDTVWLDVSIIGNEGISAFDVNLKFDSKVFYVDEEEEYCISGTALNEKGTLSSSVNSRGVEVLWYNTSDINADGVLFSICLHIAEGVPAGTYPVEIGIVSRNTVNENEEILNVTGVDGSISVRSFTPTIYVGENVADCKDEYCLPICIQDNPGIAAITVDLIFNKTKLIPAVEEDSVKTIRSTDFCDGILLCRETETGVKLLWTNSVNTTNDGIIGYIHLSPAGQCGTEPIDIFVSYDADNSLNADEEMVSFECGNGSISVKHKELNHVGAVVPKCEEAGNIEYWYCDYCKNYYDSEKTDSYVSKDSLSIDATGHTIIILPETEPSCTEKGLTEGRYCKICGTEFAKQLPIDELGHDYENGLCSRCNIYDGKTIITGNVNDSIAWKFIPDGTLILYGMGEIPDCEYSEDAPWSRLNDVVTKLVIPSTITSLGDNSFAGFEKISNIDYLGTLADWSVLNKGFGNSLFDAIVPNCYKIVDSIELDVDAQIDLTEEKTRQISVTVSPIDAVSNILFKSSDESIATVDEFGLVTFKKDGRVTITATADDVYGVNTSVTINAYYYSLQMNLSIRSDSVSAVLYEGDTANIIVSADRIISSDKLIFSSSDANILSVDEKGMLVANGRGTATITARLKDDPYSRKATINFTVLKPVGDTYISIDGEKIDEEGIVLEKKSEKRLFTIKVEEKTQSYSFSTTDKTVAYIDAGKLIIPKNAIGKCTVSAVSKDNTTVIKFPVTVMDYAPRLATSSITLNNNLIDGVNVAMYESYGKAISRVELHDIVDGRVKDEITEKVCAEYDNEVLNIKDAGIGLKNGKTASFQLWTYYEDETLEVNKALKLTVYRSDSYPTTKVTASGKYRLFYTDEVVGLKITAGKVTVTNAEIVDGTSSYSGEFADGGLNIKYTGKKINSKIAGGKARVYFDGYKGYKVISLSVATSSSAPSIRLSSSSTTIYTKAEDISIPLKILNSDGTDAVIDDNAVSITNSVTEFVQNGNALTLEYKGTTKAVISISVKNSNWSKPVKLSFTIYVVNKASTLPTVSLKKTTLSLNRNYTSFGDETALKLSQNNVSVLDTELVQKGSAKTDAVKITLENGVIKASIIEGMTPAKGTYYYKFTPEFDDGRKATTSKTVTLKVVDTKASATVKQSGTLDLIRRDTSALTFKVSVKAVSGNVTGVSLAGTDADKFNVELGEKTNTAKVTFKDDVVYAVKSYKIRFVFNIEGVAEPVKTAEQTIYVKQGTVKATVTPVTVTLYQAKDESNLFVFDVKLTSPSGAEIAEAKIGKIDSAFRKILAESASNISWTISEDGKTMRIYVIFNDMTKLVAGKSYVLPITLIPKDAINSKANGSVKMTFKIKK